jgi:hypothetical protein
MPFGIIHMTTLIRVIAALANLGIACWMFYALLHKPAPEGLWPISFVLATSLISLVALWRSHGKASTGGFFSARLHRLSLQEQRLALEEQKKIDQLSGPSK